MADLNAARLSEADLTGADLSGANRSRAGILSTIIRRALMDGANFEAATVASTIFGDVDLSSRLGLDSVHHLRPSTLGVDSIIHSKGKIPGWPCTSHS